MTKLVSTREEEEGAIRHIVTSWNLKDTKRESTSNMSDKYTCILKGRNDTVVRSRKWKES
jgi:hypothetical protein